MQLPNSIITMHAYTRRYNVSHSNDKTTNQCIGMKARTLDAALTYKTRCNDKIICICSVSLALKSFHPKMFSKLLKKESQNSRYFFSKVCCKFFLNFIENFCRIFPKFKQNVFKINCKKNP